MDGWRLAVSSRQLAVGSWQFTVNGSRLTVNGFRFSVDGSRFSSFRPTGFVLGDFAVQSSSMLNKSGEISKQ